jgi:hypothetical protein
MLDAIAAIDELGMEAAVDTSGTGLDTPVTTPSQGSSMQKTDLSQALMDMMEGLADSAEPSLQLVSDQSVADALADAIPGLDPTTLPDSLQQEPEDGVEKPIAELDEPDTLGEAFQAVSDGFESLSKSFEMLAATFLTQEVDPDGVAIGTEGDDTNADLEVTTLAGDEVDDSELAADTGAIEGEPDEIEPVETLMADADFDLDFDALKANVTQVSQGLQFLVEQLEAAFEGEDTTTEAIL